MLALAYGAVRGVVGDPAVRIFLIYFVTFLAYQLSRPYLPIIVEDVAGPGLGLGLASAIGLVMGTAALVGAVAATAALGDRLGFRPVLLGALVGGGTALLPTPLAPVVLLLARP